MRLLFTTNVAHAMKCRVNVEGSNVVEEVVHYHAFFYVASNGMSDFGMESQWLHVDHSDDVTEVSIGMTWLASYLQRQPLSSPTDATGARQPRHAALLQDGLGGSSQRRGCLCI